MPIVLRGSKGGSQQAQRALRGRYGNHAAGEAAL